jgi:ABC-2 type transport system ATP-binding protein
VRVGGFDVVTESEKVRQAIGLSGQYAAVDEDLTGFENLDMVGRLYGLGRRRSRERADELLARFDLVEAAGRPVKGYSGGMRRRLDLAGALVNEPRILFLDEPTTGLDPRSRLGMWEVLEALVSAGGTLLLTTQYLEEADRLADDIVVIDKGTVIAGGTPEDLKSRVGGDRVELTVAPGGDLTRAREALAPLADGDVTVDTRGRTVVVPVTGGSTVLVEAIRRLDQEGVAVVDIGLRRPTLDDAFLSLTGHGTDESGTDTPQADDRKQVTA